MGEKKERESIKLKRDDKLGLILFLKLRFCVFICLGKKWLELLLFMWKRLEGVRCFRYLWCRFNVFFFWLVMDLKGIEIFGNIFLLD